MLTNFSHKKAISKNHFHWQFSSCEHGLFFQQQRSFHIIKTTKANVVKKLETNFLFNYTIIKFTKGGMLMEWLKKLSAAIDYIEDNLDGSISYDEAAQIACCSTFYFQRIFSYVSAFPYQNIYDAEE